MTLAKLRIGQLGLGQWGGTLLRAFNSTEGAALTTACDADRRQFASLASTYPKVEFVTDPAELLDSPTIDALVIATPAETHYELAKAAILAGKHVFVEKPFVLDLKQAQELVELADRRSLVLMVGHLLLYHPAYVELKRRVHQPEFGDLYYLTSERCNLGRIRSNENVMWSFAPHDVALILWILEERPQLVRAVGRAYLQPHIEDVCFMEMHFASGRFAHVHTSWLFPRKVRTFTAVGSRQLIDVDDTQLSNKMTVVEVTSSIRPDLAPYEDRYHYELATFRRGDTLIPQLDNSEPLALECAEFVQSIRDRRQPLTSGQASLSVVDVLSAAQLSLRTGEPVPLD